MYSDKIQQVRVGALETGVANRIMDLLDKLRLNSDENSAKRWIWELIQNAKDVVNTTGEVNINIHFDADKSIIRFEHDGKLFSTESLIYLIEQVSTKDRDIESKTTGKFGTGFLTTHLLSEVVTVSGILKDDDSSIYRKFNIELDRSGENKEEIIAAIQKSFKALNESRELSTNMVINEKGFNTSFVYQLNEAGIKVAKEGLAALYISIPYVFAFVPEINSISVDAYGWYFERGNTHGTRKNNLKVYETKCKKNIFDEKSVYIAVLEEIAVSVAVEIEKGDRISILENSKDLPKLFCEFPLLGTEEFPFPVVVNSKRFNPTEPRDGIFLTDKSSSKIVENKNLINKAYALYVELLEYVSERNYQQIYNMTKICDPAEKSWLSNHWFNDNVLSKCKESLRYMPMIDTEIGERKALYNKLDEPQIWIIGDKDSNLRGSVWKLENHIMPEMLIRRSEIHYWYHSLGREFHNFNIKKLIKQVEEYETLDKLAEFFILSDITETDWLNELFELIGKHKIGQTYILNENIKIFPNQNGDFCSAGTLRKDLDVDENYKDVLTLLGGDCRTKLLHKAVNISDWVVFDDYCSDNIFGEIIGLLEQESDKKDIVYGRLVTLYNDLDESNKELSILIDYVDVVFPTYLPDNKQVNVVSEELIESSMKYISTKIADRISSYGNLSELSRNIKLADNKIVEDWLGGFVDYLVRYKYDNLLNKKTKPILPNQNGQFMIKDELFLDAGDMDEELKDIACIAGNDIRQMLLTKEIFLELPENRIKNITDIAPDIVQYIKANQGTKIDDLMVINTFRKLYQWLRTEEDKAKKYFLEIYKNKHWLYNDEEIAENMKKAETLDELMKRYNINNHEMLEEILNNSMNCSPISHDKNKDKTEVTEDLLIQSGIYNEAGLAKAISNNVFGENFIHMSEQDSEKFKYVNEILERSKQNVLNYLRHIPEYNLDNMIELDRTIFLIKKYDTDIFLIIRPSDYKQVILYYDSEMDILDYEKDWELWVEDGRNTPEKITFGKMLKLTGINKIPLRKVR